MNKIESITVKTIVDEHDNTSWLGEYTDDLDEGVIIRRDNEFYEKIPTEKATLDLPELGNLHKNESQGITCIEKECKIDFNGITFENSGAFIGIDVNGLYGGCVYGEWERKEVTNWHGTLRVKANYGRKYQSNFGDTRCHVWFTWKGVKFHGTWCSIEWNQLIRVKQIK